MTEEIIEKETADELALRVEVEESANDGELLDLPQISGRPEKDLGLNR